MAVINDLKKGGVTALALGLGVLSLVPAVLPVLARGARPMLRGAFKGGLVCLEKGKEAVEEIRKILEDSAHEPPGGRHSPQPGKTAPGPAARPADPRPLMAATGEPDPEVMG